jgi:hypothetical protein
MEGSKNKTRGASNSAGPTKEKKGKGSDGKLKKFKDSEKGGKSTKGQYGFKEGESSGFDKKSGER